MLILIMEPALLHQYHMVPKLYTRVFAMFSALRQHRLQSSTGRAALFGDAGYY